MPETKAAKPDPASQPEDQESAQTPEAKTRQGPSRAYSTLIFRNNAHQRGLKTSVLSVFSRGRDVRYRTPPAQIRTSAL